MATNCGTEIAITGFVRTIATSQLVMEGVGWSAGRMQILTYLAHGNNSLTAYGVHIGATWRILLNRPRAAAMRPYVKLL